MRLFFIHEYLQMYVVLKCFVIIEFPHRMHYFIMSLWLLDIWFFLHYYQLLEDSHQTSPVLVLFLHSFGTQCITFFRNAFTHGSSHLCGSLIIKYILIALILSEFWPCSLWLLMICRLVGANNQIYLLDGVEENNQPCSHELLYFTDVHA